MPHVALYINYTAKGTRICRFAPKVAKILTMCLQVILKLNGLVLLLTPCLPDFSCTEARTCFAKDLGFLNILRFPMVSRADIRGLGRRAGVRAFSQP